MNKYNKEKLENIVKDCLSIAEVCRRLNLKEAGGNYKTLKNYFKKFQINTNHFTGQGWNKDARYNFFGKKQDITNILVKNSTYTNLKSLKKRLLEDNLKEYKCEKCGIDTWCGEELSLHLDHINGVNNDHRLENLKFLCPNCHSLTSTYCGKNKNKK